MKVLGYILVMIAAVAVLVAGYYLGIAMAIVTAVFSAIGFIILVLIALSYMLWEAFRGDKRHRR